MSDEYPIAGFHFKVTIMSPGGAADTSFQEVGGIGPEMETESYHEGGENRFVHTLPKGVKHPKLILKRGLAAYSSPLVQWCRSVLEGGLATRITPQLVLVSLLDPEARPLRSWSFENAYPSHWTVDEFQSDKNGVAIEKIEMNYAVSTRQL